METTDLIEMLRGFAVGSRAIGNRTVADMVTMAADRLESLDKRWKRTVVERDQARQMRERAERLLANAEEDKRTLTRINEDWRDEVDRLHKEVTKARDLGAKLADVAAGSQAPGSNYQKILKLAPWEMATWILGTATVCDCCDRHGSCGIPEEEVTDVYCLEHIMRWLSEEVAE